MSRKTTRPKKSRAAEIESCEPQEPRAPITLEEAASLLVALDSSDTTAMTQLRDRLTAMADADTANERIHDCVIKAVKVLSEAVEGTPTEETLQAAAGLIEMAMREREDGPATEPVNAPAIAQQETAPEALAGSGQESLLPAEADVELLTEFITESRECLDSAEAALLCLEADPDDAEAVNTVFRAFHTIKGTSGFLGVAPVSKLAHGAETLLSRVRDHEIRCTGGYADLALRAADMLKKLLQSLQDTFSGGRADVPCDYAELMRVLENPEAAGITDRRGEVGKEPQPPADLSVAAESAGGEHAEADQEGHKVSPTGPAVPEIENATPLEPAGPQHVPQHPTNPDRVESSMRVRTERLDRLIDMIGELVIAQSMISQDETVLSAGHHELLKKVTHAGKIVRELHDLSLSMRMLPLKATFQKMTRLVRDLAHKSAKQVAFETDGEETEIDRNMVDVIGDPLVHMVRNAVDHGIEPPADREKIGKGRSGMIRLSAYHSGGNVVVELKDDGRGLNRDKILEKAIAKGFVDSEKGLSDGDIYNLIFLPGFSTADKVTEVSGRGVGMDVVRRNVEALRGQIAIASEPGKGCTFTLRLPLTLAITDGMLVKVGEERYIIPTVGIHLSFRPQPAAVSTVMGKVGEMVTLRGELLPIFRLHQLFSVKHAIEDLTRGLLVVVGDGDRRCALLVDELLGQQQVVAKALGNGIGKIQGISGGAILGDGRVGLILDTSEIVSLAKGILECKTAA